MTDTDDYRSSSAHGRNRKLSAWTETDGGLEAFAEDDGDDRGDDE